MHDVAVSTLPSPAPYTSGIREWSEARPPVQSKQRAILDPAQTASAPSSPLRSLAIPRDFFGGRRSVAFGRHVVKSCDPVVEIFALVRGKMSGILEAHCEQRCTVAVLLDSQHVEGPRQHHPVSDLELRRAFVDVI